MGSGRLLQRKQQRPPGEAHRQGEGRFENSLSLDAGGLASHDRKPFSSKVGWPMLRLPGKEVKPACDRARTCQAVGYPWYDVPRLVAIS